MYISSLKDNSRDFSFSLLSQTLEILSVIFNLILLFMFVSDVHLETMQGCRYVCTLFTGELGLNFFGVIHRNSSNIKILSRHKRLLFQEFFLPCCIPSQSSWRFRLLDSFRMEVHILAVEGLPGAYQMLGDLKQLWWQVFVLFCFDPCDFSASITSRHHRRAIDAYNSRDRPVKNIIVSPTMSDGTQCTIGKALL